MNRQNPNRRGGAVRLGAFLPALMLWGVSQWAAAATVTLTPSSLLLSPGDRFDVLVSAADFPETGIANLGLSFDPAVIYVTGASVEDASKFDVVDSSGIDNTSGSVAAITAFAPLFGSLPSGGFDAFSIQFLAIAPGNSVISLIDDGGQLSWTGNDFNPVAGITYLQTSVTVVPLPAAFWLLTAGLVPLWARRQRRC